jgi:cell wall-associated NlpC family hydrolase
MNDLRAVTTARDQYAAEKKTLDEQVKQLAAQDADLASKKKEIESQIAALQKIRQAAGAAAATAAKLSGACPIEAASGAAATAVQTACAQRGKPYVYGAEGPNTFDCSGLTMYAWKAAGRTLPHNAKAQYQAITHISRDQVRPGDLVFFYTDLHHVGMAIGGGMMVHAPRTGELVQMSSMDRPGVATYYGRVG